MKLFYQLLCIASWLCLGTIYPILAQDQNYVRTYTVMKTGQNGSDVNVTDKKDVQVTTQYFDGLGRPIQTVTKQGSPDGYDVIQPIQYDGFGRQVNRYLPYAQQGANTGVFRPNALGSVYTASEQYFFYNNTNNAANDTKPFSITGYDNSPLNRVTSELGPGNNWHSADKKAQMQYLVNVKRNEANKIHLPNDPVFPNPVTGQANTYISTELVELQTGFEFEATSGGTFQAYISEYAPAEVHIWDIVNNTPVNQGIYPAGEISVMHTIDEQGNSTYEFKDKLDRVILKKVEQGANDQGEPLFLWTYYIYDDFGNLRFVLPPKAVEEMRKNNWAYSNFVKEELSFYYQYDARQRLIVKNVPGAGEVHMVYDLLDRLSMTQDARQRALPTKEWTFTKYDVFGRAVMTGILKNSNDRAHHQTQANAVTHLHVATQNFSGAVALEGYYDATYPTVAANSLLTVSYYDSYAPLGNPTFQLGSGNAYISALNTAVDYWNTASYPNIPAMPQPESVVADLRVKGLLTGTKTKVLDGSNSWLTTIQFYDKKSRVIQIQADNHLGGKDILTTQYDFTGMVRATHLHHKNPQANRTDTRVTTTYALDHAGRMIYTEQQINNQTWETIAYNDYNEIGELTQKTLGLNAPAGSRATQVVDYGYNIRGWLKNINGADLTEPNQGDLFGMELFYENGLGTSQYNGNISGVKWQSESSEAIRQYTYAYDQVNRLKGATYSDNDPSVTEQFSVSNISYDANGNILSLNREGLIAFDGNNLVSQEFGQMDRLRYSYNGNKLESVTDLTGQHLAFAGDFKDGNTSGNDYLYDANGNMREDKNKGITSIEYNHLNLPQKVTFGTDKWIAYTYDAAGIKLRKEVFENNTLSKVTNYIGAFVYEQDTLQFIHTDEGRALAPEVLPFEQRTDFAYEYQYKDHLGNLRLSFRDARLTYQATMEEGKGEEAIFENIPNTRDNTIAYQGSYAAKLNVASHPVGPYKEMKVSKGDQVSLSTYVRYNTTPADNESGLWNDFLNTNFGASRQETGSSYGNLGAGISLFPVNQSSNNLPDAYLQIIFYDENDTPQQQGIVLVNAQAYQNWEQYELNNLVVQNDGYAKVFVANESEIDVWFDDIEIVHSKVIVQENHYYPFGLNLTGLDKTGNPDHKFQYNQGTGDDAFKTEREQDFGLNWDLTKHRTYDYQLGRFNQVDPLADQGGQESLTSYQYGFNNPISYYDPIGLMANCKDCPPKKGNGVTTSLFNKFEIKSTLGIQAGFDILGIAEIDFNAVNMKLFTFEHEEKGNESKTSWKAVNKGEEITVNNETGTVNTKEKDGVDISNSLGISILGVGGGVAQEQNIKDGSSSGFKQKVVNSESLLIDGATRETETEWEGNKIKNVDSIKWSIGIKLFLGLEISYQSGTEITSGN